MGNTDPFDGKIYARFDGAQDSGSLSSICADLLAEQRESWQDLREGYRSLQKVKERHLLCNGFSVRLNYNPGRLVNTTAAEGEKRAGDSSCFLCIERLPEGQKGILWRKEYLILCNPRPVFSTHLTISHIEHRPQAIADRINILLQLMGDLGPGWTVLYNGSRCGASAPGHLHFQSFPSCRTPVEKESAELGRLVPVAHLKKNRLCRALHLGRQAVILDGDDSTVMGLFFERFVDGLKRVLGSDDEPMVNIVGVREERGSRLVIFLRGKHRPAVFYNQGEDRIVVSPGAIDMGGVLITPVEKDFERLDAAMVQKIYEEVSLEGDFVERVLKPEILGAGISLDGD
jgi:hypothetical protein